MNIEKQAIPEVKCHSREKTNAVGRTVDFQLLMVVYSWVKIQISNPINVRRSLSLDNTYWHILHEVLYVNTEGKNNFRTDLDNV